MHIDILKKYSNAKLINGVDGYAITDCGKVLSLPRSILTTHPKTKNKMVVNIKNLIELKPTISTHNHLKVYLSVKGKKKTFYIKNLVAEAFLKKPITKKILVVVHIDENKKNCSSKNLMWMTFSQLCCFTNSVDYRNNFNK